MTAYIDYIKAYLSSCPPNYGDDEIHSILEYLWHHYTTDNPINNNFIKSRFTALRSIWDTLSPADQDLLFYTVTDLCIEYERSAFLSGLQTGARLMTELDGSANE